MIFAVRLSTELKTAVAPLRRVVLPVLAISSVYNVLMLSGSFFMLLVYDDVIPSRSVPSLVSLLVLVALAYGFQAVLDVVRGRVMVQVGSLFMRGVSDRVLDVLSRHELARGPIPNGTQVVRDADTVRGYLSGPGPLAIADLPWVLAYLLILTVFHWSIGLLPLAGVLVLFLRWGSRFHAAAPPMTATCLLRIRAHSFERLRTWHFRQIRQSSVPSSHAAAPLALKTNSFSKGPPARQIECRRLMLNKTNHLQLSHELTNRRGQILSSFDSSKTDGGSFISSSLICLHLQTPTDASSDLHYICQAGCPPSAAWLPNRDAIPCNEAASTLQPMSRRLAARLRRWHWLAYVK